MSRVARARRGTRPAGRRGTGGAVPGGGEGRGRGDRLLARLFGAERVSPGVQALDGHDARGGAPTPTSRRGRVAPAVIPCAQRAPPPDVGLALTATCLYGHATSIERSRSRR